MKSFFIITVLVFLVGMTKAQAGEETTQDPPVDGISTTEAEEDEDDMESVEYCSKSKISTNVQEIDYSWTLDGVLKYMERLGHSNFNKMQLQLNVTDLKFHEDQLQGNWSFAIFKEKSSSVHIQMIYTALDADHLTVNGEVLMKLPCGTVLSPRLVCDKTHSYPEYNTNYNYHHFTNYSGHNDAYMTKTVFQLTWVLEDSVVQSLMAKTREVEDKTSPKSNNNAPPMVDEIDLLFHIDTLETKPTLIKLSQNCSTSTVAHHKKNMPITEPLSTTSMYHYSTVPSLPHSSSFNSIG